MVLLNAIAGAFLLVSNFLYHPQFAPLPTVNGAVPLLPQTLTLPVQKLAATRFPPVKAAAYLVIDKTSLEVLAEKDADVPLPPASTTKIMTALVVLEQLPLDSIVTVPEKFEHTGSLMKLIPGEKLRRGDLLAGMLIHSSNDAASVLALTYPGGEEAFVAQMNAMAQRLGLIHTRYLNVSGLQQPGHMSTVRDLLVLSRYAMQNPQFASLVRTQKVIITSVDGKNIHPLETTNKLLGVEGVEGIKTGYTEEAGECLVTQVTRGGHTVYTALLGSTDRFSETKALIDWVYGGFAWETRPLSAWVSD